MTAHHHTRRTPRRTAMAGALAAAALFAGGLATAPTAAADPADCTVSGGTVTCPAGAGTFTFRAVAECWDAYPNMNFQRMMYGPWVQASTTQATSSRVQGECHGYVPGSGVIINHRMEVAG